MSRSWPTNDELSAGLVIDADRFRVATSLYRDAEVFEAELSILFERSWVYLCHESEVSTPGDYRAVSVGRQPVLVTRTESGDVRAFLNVCRHRGSVLCRTESGNSNYFSCPYHGWKYSNEGILVGIPQRKQGYEQTFGRGEEDGLVPLPRVESFRGLVFGSLEASVPDLSAWLGQAAPYIELWADRSPDGRTTVVAPPHRYSYPGNWKLQAENGTDGYHGNYVHESFFQILDEFGESDMKKVRTFREDGCTRGFDNGHALLERPGPTKGNPVDGRRGADAFLRYHDELTEAYGAEHRDQILTQRNIFIFPNVYLFDRSIRVIVPKAVNETEVIVSFTWLDGADDELNEDRLAEHQRFFATAGFGIPDDLEIFASVATGVRAAGMEWMLLDRGMSDEKVLENGERIGHSTAETPQRAFWYGWRERMVAVPQVNSQEFAQ